MSGCKILGVLLLCAGVALSSTHVSLPHDSFYYSSGNTQNYRNCYRNLHCKSPLGFIGQAFKDVIQLNLNILSYDTVKILGVAFPAYAGSRMVDEDLQRHFFCHDTHKNINQCPKWCHEVIRFGLAVPIVLLGSQLFLSHDPEWREAAWFLLLGIPFVIFGKDLLKTIDAECCLRPWHEDFCQKHKRAMGGFPSGHMAQAAYITVLYGMRFGPKLAIPLALYATALGIVFINCNRHYVSQIVAGAALGTIYAFAANRTIDDKLSEDLTFKVCLKKNGAALCCNYRF